ncbi:hypothetical protein HanIR_Chr03g0128631 [Helianthus annuus]|nr:hypothetical protein HanIR_Chr03g0128631 [Helianthus annuus]
MTSSSFTLQKLSFSCISISFFELGPISSFSCISISFFELGPISSFSCLSSITFELGVAPESSFSWNFRLKRLLMRVCFFIF